MEQELTNVVKHVAHQIVALMKLQHRMVNVKDVWLVSKSLRIEDHVTKLLSAYQINTKIDMDNAKDARHTTNWMPVEQDAILLDAQEIKEFCLMDDVWIVKIALGWAKMEDNVRLKHVKVDKFFNKMDLAEAVHLVREL